jgi:tRNA(fMet)-specific endonuclease VapC
MTIYMLDTNIASDIIKGDSSLVRARLVSIPMHSLAVSVVTQAELLYGVAKRGHPAGLTLRVREFLVRVETLPWNSEVAGVYAGLRTTCEAAGVTLAPMHMMIAAHAKALSAVLVTRDRVFGLIPDGPPLEDWTMQELHGGRSPKQA